MAKTRSQKETEVTALIAAINAAKLAVLTDYRGLDVPAINELRTNLREAGISFKVTKNTLVKLALAQSNKKDADTSVFTGPMAIAFGADEVEAAKIIDTFGRRHEQLEIVGALTEDGRIIPPEEVKQLAKLPGRAELTGQVVGVIAAPLTGFVRVLNGTLTSLLYALNAIGEAKQ